jgi:release factor glutamine methyltransferase
MPNAGFVAWHQHNCQCVPASIDELLSRSASRADATLLLAHVMRRERAWLVAHGGATPSAEEAEAFERLSAQRARGIPTAYLLGSAGFYGREFLVDENVLIPRPETEHLVDEAIRFIGKRPLRALDVGTGSGAIACTIAAQTHATVDATDISPAAVEIAKKNAERLKVSCDFYVGDLIEPVKNKRYDVIIANLPYVPTKDIPEKPDPIAFEPLVALDGGPDGLALYRRLLDALPSLATPDALILLEAAPPTIAALAEAAKSIFPNTAIAVRRDYAGLNRYVRISRASSLPSCPASHESAR